MDREVVELYPGDDRESSISNRFGYVHLETLFFDEDDGKFEKEVCNKNFIDNLLFMKMDETTRNISYDLKGLIHSLFVYLLGCKIICLFHIH